VKVFKPKDFLEFDLARPPQVDKTKNREGKKLKKSKKKAPKSGAVEANTSTENSTTGSKRSRPKMAAADANQRNIKVPSSTAVTTSTSDQTGKVPSKASFCTPIHAQEQSLTMQLLGTKEDSFPFPLKSQDACPFSLKSKFASRPTTRKSYSTGKAHSRSKGIQLAREQARARTLAAVRVGSSI
jgi:hypothetical protein